MPSLNDPQYKKAALRKSEVVFPAHKKAAAAPSTSQIWSAAPSPRVCASLLKRLQSVRTALGARCSELAAGRSKTLLTERSPGKYSDTRRFCISETARVFFFSLPPQFVQIPVCFGKKKTAIKRRLFELATGGVAEPLVPRTNWGPTWPCVHFNAVAHSAAYAEKVPLFLLFGFRMMRPP